MTYIALKPCSFAGQAFRIGEEIPEILLLPEAINGLVKMGVIAAGDGAQPEAGAQSPEEGTQSPAKVEIKVKVDEETHTLHIPADELQHIFDALCGTVEEAEKVIDQMCDAEALALLDLADKRKSINTAAAARLKALSESQESAGEQ